MIFKDFKQRKINRGVLVSYVPLHYCTALLLKPKSVLLYHCSQLFSCNPGCRKESHHEDHCQQSEEVIFSLSSALMRPQLSHLIHVQCWVSQYKKDMDILESPAKSYSDDEELGPSDMWGEAEQAWAVQPGKEMAQGNLTHAYKFLMG